VLHAGINERDGLTVEVVRKRCRRINLRVDAQGGVHLTIPKVWATLAEGEAFLAAKWPWVVKTREKLLSRPAATRAPVTESDIERLRTFLSELNNRWSNRLGETGVVWRIRRVKSVWGCCHWRKRYITYNADLAQAPVELIEYVVVHEFTHFTVHGHGPAFQALMDRRLPSWRDLRRTLNRREWVPTAPSVGSDRNML